MWISTAPALGEYIPKAPKDEEAKKYNQNLPGMGGVFDHINGNLYHYAGNSPVSYTDPEGRIKTEYIANKDTEVLQSIAADTSRDKKITYSPIKGKGGGVQYFSNKNRDFKAICK